ncbi:MAG: hypothetical protein A3E83_00145 [Gammaproteobacteria bacterium RIFCSPHIGHO2_12_FULL_41_20]|nr:MAG: hypothetical protein A3E83_00145 [Gammaproteobacteria bacterium RIFCSPHIGHO2_12_FULL_41_20]
MSNSRDNNPQQKRNNYKSADNKGSPLAFPVTGRSSGSMYKKFDRPPTPFNRGDNAAEDSEGEEPVNNSRKP